MKPHIDDDLLMKYLLQEADEQEVQLVKTWLKNSPENQKHFDGIKFIWEESLSLAEGNKEMESIAWNKIEDRLQFNAPSSAVSKTTYSIYRPWLLSAASVLLICSLGWFMFNYFSAPRIVNTQAKEQVFTQLLPDGSKVTLNKNTSISYPGKFTGTTRPVTLKGEAFFSVAPDASKPFIIRVNDVRIKVIGTSFNVKGRKGKTIVVVQKGVVMVSKSQNNIELHPGEYVAIDQRQTKLSKQNNRNTLYNYYHSNELKCDGTPLRELVEVLNEKFKKNIVIVSPALQTMSITANFTNKSPEEILTVISTTFKVHIEQKDQQLLLK